MLKTLYIKNYALIDSLEIDFESGFSVITGETGAGKSIILGALSLILGQRADVKSVKQGESKCIIEGSFDVSAYDLKSFCEDRGIEYDNDHCILRREIFSSGKSRAFINDSPVGLNDLKELGGQLIDVHSQHQNLLLNDARFQMQIVDALAGNKDLLSKYKKAYNAYKDAELRLEQLREYVQKSKEEEDYFRFQFEVLQEASLREGEQEELEGELELLNNSEEIKSCLYKIYEHLSEDERGVVSMLKDSLNNASSLIRMFPKSEEMLLRLESAYLDMKDLSTEVERYANDVEFNPDRLSAIEERLDLLYTLQKKYRLSTITELLSLQEELSQKLEKIDSFDLQLEELRKEVAEKYNITEEFANQLTKNRKKVIPLLEKDLIEKVAYLGMPNVRFECKITTNKEFGLYGRDELLFLFSANKNVPLQPVASIASGGEISRLMLCIKSMIAGATALPTIIFDEIDTGVSGEIADKMGEVMADFGSKMQVIAITHLPQIASKGREHYKVYKIDEDDTTKTNLIRLSMEQRLDEVARMLSGSVVTDAAIQNAKELLGVK